MRNQTTNIKEIRNNTIAGIACQFIPLYLTDSIGSFLQDTPGFEAISFLISALAFIMFCFGYGLCAVAADRYAAYKGYRNPLFVYGILNIFGLSILFLLTNKKTSEAHLKEPLSKFSITSILASYLLIPLLIVPVLLIFAFIFAGVEGFEEYYQNNQGFSTLSELIVLIAIAWYFIKEFNRSKINYKYILGSLRRINFKLPIGLAIIEYLFAGGINPIILYGLSFVVPNYVEYQINKEYATTTTSWIFFSIAALIYAPIMEELFFRGIIFQKLALKKGFFYGSIISAILFTVIHFRYDVISLCIMGLVSVILYFKTKQLTTSIIYHFVYNLIVVIRRLYYQLSNTDPATQTTIAEYQQHFSDRWQLYILLLAISTPYLCYFIYKNYPRNYKVDKLPYFANQ